MIGIRADANETVATGHIMRCITIAGQLKRCGEQVIFFTADDYAHDMLKKSGMSYVCLNTSWNRMEEETASLKRELKKYGCTKLLVDSYQATKKYFECLKDSCRLIYIDDCFEDIYPVDMLINYNAFHIRFPYAEAYEQKNGRETALLLGTAYVPLREEFTVPQAVSGMSASDGESSFHVLLSSGGGDRYDALSGILNCFIGTEENIVFHVIVGKFNSNEQELRRLAEKYPYIKLYYDIKMAELMSRCDAAVSAAGTMLFELCAMQVPAVFFVSADNQKYDSEFFAEEERMLYGGDMREGREACLENICTQLKIILGDDNMRRRMKLKLHEVTDGRGAERLAEAIASL